MRRQGSGQALVEYVVLLALGSLIAIGTVSLAGTQLSQAYSQISTLLANPAAAIVPTASPTPSELATATGSPTPTATSPTATTPTATTPTPSASHDTGDASHSNGHAGGNGHAHD
jgi:Flp pilus assembly pilin Flp